MTRLFLIALVVAMAAACLAGCGASSSGEASTASSSNDGTSAEPTAPPAFADALEEAAKSGVAVRIPTKLIESPPAGASHAEVLSGRKLTLADGIEGVYEPGRCGPGCEFGTVAWRQGGDVYGVGVPEASTAELVTIANEAIEAEPLTGP